MPFFVRRPVVLLLLVGFLGLFTQVTDARAQAKIGRDGNAVQGQTVPRDVREIYDRGLLWLENTQDESGGWSKSGGMSGGGVSGLALMAFLASGEDPNFGKHSIPVRKSIQSIIRGQNPNTGYLGDSMYQHGFATLALAEA